MIFSYRTLINRIEIHMYFFSKFYRFLIENLKMYLINVVIWVFLTYMIVNVFCKRENFLPLYCINPVSFSSKSAKISSMSVADTFSCIEPNNAISSPLFKAPSPSLSKFWNSFWSSESLSFVSFRFTMETTSSSNVILPSPVIT